MKVLAAEATEHLQKLRADGMPWSELVALTGVPKNSLYAMQSQERVNIDTARAVLAIGAGDHATDEMWSAEHDLGDGDWRLDPFTRVQVWVPKTVPVEPKNRCECGTEIGDKATRCAGCTRVGAPRKPIRHGTPGGYRAHLRRSDPACDDCMTAMREDSTRRRNSKSTTEKRAA